MSVHGQKPSESYIFFDVDGTVVEVDTGQELFHEADECHRDEFHDLMSETHVPGRDEPESGRGNELLETLTSKPQEKISELKEAAKALNAEPRPGLEKAIKGLSQNGQKVFAHSAGWMPAIDAVTNGHFDGKFAGQIEEGEPVFNGRYQKPVRMQNYLVDQGYEPVETETVFIGDSDTDLEAIRYAAATEGYGIALSDTADKADDRVTEASVYVGSPQGDYAAALLHELTSEGNTEEFVEENDLDLSNGEAKPGYLEDYEVQQEIQQAIDSVDEIR